jgi:WD40 repeat protein
MGMVTNLVTGDPQRWPHELQPIATYSPAIGAGLLLAVGARAGWQVWRNGISRPEWTGSNPYPGLMAYTEQWAGVFFGRGPEVQELVTRVRHARDPTGRFVPVVGPSGSGKSSLVLAGLLAALRSGSEVRVAPPFNPGGNAVGELAAVLGIDLTGAARAALYAARAGEPAPHLDEALAALTRLRNGARALLLVVDQLEEAVTLCLPEDRHALMALCEALLEQEPRLRIVATVRSDTVGAFQQGPGRDLFRHPLMVNVLGAREIRMVVHEPARLTGTTFDDGLIDEIVRDAGGGDALPLLSYLLSDLYRNAGRDRHITWQEYQAGGGVSGAITRQAQAAVRELGTGTLEFCLDTLLRFVTLGPGGATRQPVRSSSLDERQLQVVRAFVDARLLISDRDDEVVFHIAHEALLRQWRPLSDHIGLHEENLRRLTELAPLARAWRQSGREVDYLITGARLADALTWARDGHGLSPELREFLDQSQRNQTGEMDRRANRVAREALASLTATPEVGTALAIAAYTELAPTPLAGYALEEALADGLLRVFQLPDVVSVAFDSSGRLVAAGHGVYEWEQTWDSIRQVHVSDQLDDGCAVACGPHRRLAVASRDGAIRVVTADQVRRTRPDFHSHAIQVAYRSDAMLAVGGGDGVVRLLDEDLREAGELVDGAGNGPAYALAAGPEGNLAAGFGDGTVLIWTGHGQLAHRLAGHRDAVFALAYGPGGILASGGRDRTVMTWSASGSAIARHVGLPAAVGALAYAPDGRLAAGFDDGRVRVWAPDGRLVHRLAEHAAPISAVAFAPDGRLAVSALDDTVRVWDLAGRLTTTTPVAAGAALALTPEGIIAVGLADGTVRFVDSAGSTLSALTGLGSRVSALVAAGDGRLAAGHVDGRISVSDTGHGETRPRILAGHRDTVTAIAFAPAGLVSGARDGVVLAWDDRDRARLVVDGGEPVFAVAALPNGDVLVGHGDHLSRLEDPFGARPRRLPEAGGVSAVAVSPVGRFAIGLADGTTEIRDAGRSPTLRLRPGHSAPVTACAFALDDRIATACANGEVRIWQADGRLLHALANRTGVVDAIAFTPDGRLAITCGDVVHVRPYGTSREKLLALAARHPRRRLSPQQREAAMLVLTPDGGR